MIAAAKTKRVQSHRSSRSIELDLVNSIYRQKTTTVKLFALRFVVPSSCLEEFGDFTVKGNVPHECSQKRMNLLAQKAVMSSLCKLV